MTDYEINEAVARKLGWKSTERKFNQPLTRPVTWYPPGHNKPHWRNIPNYCRSIEAAWKVVEHVGKHSSWSMYWLGGPDEKKFWRVAILGSEYVDADTVPMAICLAFLKLP